MANIPGTNVPAITFTQNGFQIPTGPLILTGVQADISAAFGSALNFSATTPQGQLASSETAVVNNQNQAFLFTVQMFDPAYSFGRYQDALGRLNDITRNGAQPTTIQVACGGANNTPIPLGATVRDEAQNIYSCTGAGTIPSTGSITLAFAANIPGPTAVPESVEIYQSIPGWDTVSVVSGTQGNSTEGRASFETRRQQSLQKNARGMLGAIQGAVLDVSGVLDCYANENDTAAPLTINGFTLAANSIYVAVVGGAAQSVAQAIYSKKMPGCAYNGNTSAVVTDTTQPNPPQPTYTVTWETPAALDFVFAVSLVQSAQVPSNAAQLIQNAIVAAFTGSAQATFTGTMTASILSVTALASGIISAGQVVTGNGVVPGTVISALLSGTGGPGTYTVNIPQQVSSTIMSAGGDGGPRMRIGSLALATRFIGPIVGLGSWAQVRSVFMGTRNSPGASFTGVIAGTTLTVSGVSGTVAIGQTLDDLTGLVAPGTTILGGSGTTWTVSISPTVSSEAMFGVVASLQSVQVQINQTPAISAGNIAVAIS